MVALPLVFAVGSLSSFVTLTGIAHAYESTTNSISPNLADNTHRVALDSTEILNNIQTVPHYCATNSC